MKLEHRHKLLSTFAFNFNLRRYIVVGAEPGDILQVDILSAEPWATWVGVEYMMHGTGTGGGAKAWCLLIRSNDQPTHLDHSGVCVRECVFKSSLGRSIRQTTADALTLMRRA